MSIKLVYKAAEVAPVCRRLSEASVKLNMPKFVVTNSNGSPHTDVAVRWGSIVPEVNAEIVINSAESVTLARNKKASRQAMGSLAPKTWFKVENVKLPAVVRPRRHHAANKFFVVTNQVELKKAILKCGVGWYASELIKKDKEYRVFVLQGRIVAVSQRFPANPTDVAWNLATGGKLINLKHASWPVPVLKAAIDATKAVGLDWSAMDIATEKVTGRVVVFEANTAPGLKNPYTLSCIAKGFNYVASHGAPKPATGIKWSGYIHPAVKSGLGV